MVIVMGLTDEQKVGIVFLVAGLAVVAATQIVINAHGQVGTYTTPAADQPWPWWRDIAYWSWVCPSYLIRHQEIEVAASASGIILLIRAHQRRE